MSFGSTSEKLLGHGHGHDHGLCLHPTGDAFVAQRAKRYVWFPVANQASAPMALPVMTSRPSPPSACSTRPSFRPAAGGGVMATSPLGGGEGSLRSGVAQPSV
jgi:hypothetical protein